MTTALIDIENNEKDGLGKSSNAKSNSGAKSPFKVLKTTDNTMVIGSE